MSGIITFHFDDGYASHFEKVYPLFRSFGVKGGLSLIADSKRGMDWDKALAMQEDGWEILCHSVTHPKMREPLDEETARHEILTAKQILENAGFRIRQFVTPYSQLHPSLIPLVQEAYDAAFTRYTDARTLPAESLFIERPANRYDLHRACMAEKTLAELCAYVDAVSEQDAWLVFYDHDIGVNQNISSETLTALLAYIKEKGVSVMTSSDALARQKCRTKILRKGWDGHECFVHARLASDGGRKMLITTQKLNVDGCDCFDLLHTSLSTNGGQTFSPFTPDPAFASVIRDGIRSVCCDMTPLFHHKTGKFLATGHTVQYREGEITPLETKYRRRVTPYAVYDEEKGAFGQVRSIQMPDPEKYGDGGSGCSQCLELENGDILIPFSFAETIDGVKQHTKAAVMRCAFDGETLTCLAVGNDLAVPDEVRGIGECSLIRVKNRYFLTIRGDTYGYVSVSDDGMTFTSPRKWCWEDGTIVPTYNTQSHFFTLGDRLYLVYTRRAGFNDHVFRHRAPLFVSEVNTDTLCLKAGTEFIAVPERGARLGNFGVCQVGQSEARILVTEWMQPKNCEKYGSDNAVWLSDIHTLSECPLRHSDNEINPLRDL